MKETPLDSILGLIEGEMAKYQRKYILISFEDNLGDVDKEKVVQAIKEHFDIFIVLESDVPAYKERIEEYFSYGVHGLYFATGVDTHSKKQTKIMNFASELFTRGWVFAKSENEEAKIKELLALKIIPVPSEYDPRLIGFIKSHQHFRKISPNLLKSIPLLDKKESDYSFADKVKMKMLLESINLRQKLMVKSVDESFGSSQL